MGLTVHFDYQKMEEEARRECQALQERLRLRRQEPPPPGEDLGWKRENSILYAMYLEQRHNQRLFARRAAWRAAERGERP